MEQAVYTLKQACEILQVSESTIRRRIKEGLIPKEQWCGKILIPAWWFKKLQVEVKEECQN